MSRDNRVSTRRTCPLVPPAVALFDFVESFAHIRPNEWDSFEHILTPVASIGVSQLPEPYVAPV